MIKLVAGNRASGKTKYVLDLLNLKGGIFVTPYDYMKNIYESKYENIKFVCCENCRLFSKLNDIINDYKSYPEKPRIAIDGFGIWCMWIARTAYDSAEWYITTLTESDLTVLTILGR